MFGSGSIATFKLNDKLASIWEPDRVGEVVSINMNYSEPVYTIRYEDGNEYANYASSFRRA